MEIMYKILYLEPVVKKHLPKLSNSIKLLIKKSIENKLMKDPIKFGKPLKYSLKAHRRLRVGEYRILYKIHSDTVTIIAIKHRKDIYE